jgi:hypothetical protein
MSAVSISPSTLICGLDLDLLSLIPSESSNPDRTSLDWILSGIANCMDRCGHLQQLTPHSIGANAQMVSSTKCRIAGAHSQVQRVS